MHHRSMRAACLAVGCACTSVGMAQSQDEAELSQIYGDKSFVSIATGTRVPTQRAPAAATVITSQDIEAMGARDLDEVLESVPGLHVSRSSSESGNPIYTFRGVHSRFNSQVQLLVNGVPYTSAFLGHRDELWAGMPVDHIARIEVLRGPGSALYGADAYSGVINIITKNAQDIDGTQVGARVGSFKSADAFGLHGGKWGAIDVAAYARVGTTRGPDRIIKSDFQTVLDGAFGTQASLAPGPLKLGYRAVDANLDLRLDAWTLRFQYKRRDDVQLTMLTGALVPRGLGDTERFAADLTYAFNRPDRAVEGGVQLSGYYSSAVYDNLMLFPAGAFGGQFPEGMIGNPDKWERGLRADTWLLYSGWRDHRVRLGAGHALQSIYRIHATQNFAYALVPGVGYLPYYLGGIFDLTDTTPWLSLHTRVFNYAVFQDEWNFAPDWTITLGIRHDRYSDFGNTTNPRLSLVWNASYDTTWRLSYGSAFRAPAFADLYAINNPGGVGNPNLKPETIKTLEAAWNWQANDALRIGATIFHNRMRDGIRLVANADPITGSTFVNAAAQSSRGLEVEFDWEPTRRWRLSGNYSYQRTRDAVSGQDAGNAPHHHVYLRADGRLTDGWSIHPQFNWVADRRREPGDLRPPIADYRTLDLTLRRQQAGVPWDASLVLRNIFNADVREPTPAPGVVPNDFPQAGRSLSLELRYRF